MNLSYLVHRSARNHKQTYLKRKLMNWKKLMELLKNYMRTREGEHAYIGYDPHYIFVFKMSVFADEDNCFAHFAEFRCQLCRISIPTLPKKNQKNGQGRDTLPNSAKWVESPTPTCRFPYQITDIFEEVSIFVVWLGRFAPIAK